MSGDRILRWWGSMASDLGLDDERLEQWAYHRDEESRRSRALHAGPHPWPFHSAVAVSPVAAYIREEVWRQGHDIEAKEGRDRIAWMTAAWEWARERARESAYPTLDEIREIGRMVEPERNATGFRDCGVRVGAHDAPPPEEVETKLKHLLGHGKCWSSHIRWYKEFQLIHPFCDGNGRTGKVLLAWLANTWDAPFFPPADLFGAPIRNP